MRPMSSGCNSDPYSSSSALMQWLNFIVTFSPNQVFWFALHLLPVTTTPFRSFFFASTHQVPKTTRRTQFDYMEIVLLNFYIMLHQIPAKYNDPKINNFICLHLTRQARTAAEYFLVWVLSSHQVCKSKHFLLIRSNDPGIRKKNRNKSNDTDETNYANNKFYDTNFFFQVERKQKI